MFVQVTKGSMYTYGLTSTGFHAQVNSLDVRLPDSITPEPSPRASASCGNYAYRIFIWNESLSGLRLRVTDSVGAACRKFCPIWTMRSRARRRARSARRAADRVVIVTDIGCVGLGGSDFPGLHTVHTLHGRSVAGRRGAEDGQPRWRAHALKVIVLIGDGGTGIGLLHLVHAAQTNVDVTVIVHNNLVYGMTGGQHSVMTLPGMKTTTTPDGCPIPRSTCSDPGRAGAASSPARCWRR